MNSFKSFVIKIKSNKYFKFFTNFYIVVSLFFIIWMLFIDTNSYLFHNTLNSEIDQLIIKKEKLNIYIHYDLCHKTYSFMVTIALVPTSSHFEQRS